MKAPSGLARVLAAALRGWAHTTGSGRDPAVRLDVRQAPDWGDVGTASLTPGQAGRLVEWMRDDVARNLPASDAGVAAARLIDLHLEDLLAEGRRTVRPRDLLDITHRTGRTKQWLSGHLAYLVADGRLTESRWRPGTYRITPPAPAWSIRPGMPTAR